MASGAELYFPERQATQQVALAPPRPHLLYFPAPQGKHIVELGAPAIVLYVPAEQAMHVKMSMAPMAALYFPAGQEEHPVEPALG